MNTKSSFIDLTQRPPRSFRVRLGNYVILARMLDTATRKHLRSLPDTWASFPKPAKTSKLGSKPLNSMTMQALEEKRKSRIHKNNEEQTTEKQKRTNYEQ